MRALRRSRPLSEPMSLLVKTVPTVTAAEFAPVALAPPGGGVGGQLPARRIATRDAPLVELCRSVAGGVSGAANGTSAWFNSND